LGHWDSAESVFCSEKLSFFPYKKQNKSLIFSFGQENSIFHNFLLDVQNYIQAFYQKRQLNSNLQFFTDQKN
jgi:hypothetical protein